MDKIAIVEPFPDSGFNMYPGIFLSLKSIFYCKGFNDESEIHRLFKFGNLGKLISLYEPPDDLNGVKEIITCQFTYSGFILKIGKKYYKTDLDFYRHQPSLLSENCRTIMLMGDNQKVKFDDYDFTKISCSIGRVINVSNMMFSSILSETPEKLVKQLLSMNDDPEKTKYTFLLNDINSFSYIRELSGEYLSKYPFRDNTAFFCKTNENNSDNIYHVMMDGTRKYSTIKFSNIHNTGESIPILAVDF